MNYKLPTPVILLYYSIVNKITLQIAKHNIYTVPEERRKTYNYNNIWVYTCY